VTAGSGCAWSVAESINWVTITSGNSGSGNGTVGYSVSANNGAARSATFTVAGRTVTVTQPQGNAAPTAPKNLRVLTQP
jgi:hypothetical protein